MAFKEYQIQLIDASTGLALNHSGSVRVTDIGVPTRVVTYGFTTEAADSSTITFSNGLIKFKTADTKNSVDIYGITEKGYPIILKGAKPGGNTSYRIDVNNRLQTLIIPWDIVDSDIADATEFDTGFDLATNQVVLSAGVGVLVETADSTETIEVGILSSESGGDADGFIDVLALTTAAFVLADVTVTTGLNTKFFAASPTKGPLLADHQAGTDLDQDEGLWREKNYVCNGTAESISLTVTTGTDTGAGYIVLPTLIPNLL
jgi:hypothetical protein